MVKKVVLFSFIAICFIGAAAFAAIQTTQLNNTQNTLASTEVELTATQSDLSNTQSTLAITDKNLSQTQTDLSDVKDELSRTLVEMQSIYQKIDVVGSEINETEAACQEANAALHDQEISNETLQSDIRALQLNYDTATLGYNYAFRDPTYQEVKDFLAADTTNLNDYVVNNYVCEDFSFDVRLHAMQQEIRCAFVYIIFADVRHAIIAFYTTDEGIIYFEPQTDEEVNLQVGRHYWSQCIIPNHLPVTDYDDTVSNYYVIW